MGTGLAWVYDCGQEKKLLWKNTLYLESVGSIVYGTCTLCPPIPFFIQSNTEES